MARAAKIAQWIGLAAWLSAVFVTLGDYSVRGCYLPDAAVHGLPAFRYQIGWPLEIGRYDDDQGRVYLSRNWSAKQAFTHCFDIYVLLAFASAPAFAILVARRCGAQWSLSHLFRFVAWAAVGLGLFQWLALGVIPARCPMNSLSSTLNSPDDPFWLWDRFATPAVLIVGWLGISYVVALAPWRRLGANADRTERA